LFARIFLWSTVGSALICGALKVRYPELDLHGLWKMPLAVASLFAVLGFNLVILPVLVPPTITVSGEQIRYSHGQSSWVAKFDDCDALKVVVFSPSVRRLIFRHKGKRRSVALAETVDLDELRSLLPYQVKLIDSRERFTLFREGRSAARR
jgi:hypothetical protein